MQSDESVSFTKVVVRSAGDVMTSSPSQSRIYNPFDHDTPNRLQHSVFSPNMFTCVSSPSDEDVMKDGKFQWPIEEQSILFPAHIDESSVFLHAEYIDGVDPEREQRIQEAIDKFWSSTKEIEALMSPAGAGGDVNAIPRVLSRLREEAASIASLSTLPTHGSPSANRYSPMIASSSDGPSVPLRKSVSAVSAVKRSRPLHATTSHQPEASPLTIYNHVADDAEEPPSAKRSCTLATQTELTFAPNADVLALLGKVYRYNEQRQRHEQRREQLSNTSMSSLRRKLFSADSELSGHSPLPNSPNLSPIRFDNSMVAPPSPHINHACV